MDAFSTFAGITLDTCTSADVDRLLGLADRFLDDWAEDAVQTDQQDKEYENRSEEWHAIRPLLLSAPEMLRGLRSIIAFCDGSSNPVAQCCVSIARTSLASLRTTTESTRS